MALPAAMERASSDNVTALTRDQMVQRKTTKERTERPHPGGRSV
jgi:hypothetical protein